MIFQNNRRLILLNFALILLSKSGDSFVVRPPIQRIGVALKTSTLLEQSSQSFDGGGDDPKHHVNFLTKAAHAATSWFLPKPKVEFLDEDDDNDDNEFILTPKQRSQLTNTKLWQEALLPFPWPLRVIGQSLTRKINRDLTVEEHKAKPLLLEAQHLMRNDEDLKSALGEPIHVQPLFSGISGMSLTTTKRVNTKKTQLIVDSFEVVGSRSRGTATMIADKYASGHIQALRVNVEGIHYDIDIDD